MSPRGGTCSKTFRPRLLLFLVATFWIVIKTGRRGFSPLSSHVFFFIVFVVKNHRQMEINIPYVGGTMTSDRWEYPRLTSDSFLIRFGQTSQRHKSPRGAAASSTGLITSIINDNRGPGAPSRTRPPSLWGSGPQTLGPDALIGLKVEPPERVHGAAAGRPDLIMKRCRRRPAGAPPPVIRRSLIRLTFPRASGCVASSDPTQSEFKWEINYA